MDSDVLYLNLPSIGMDPSNKSGRGIEQNRYRGRSLFYLESEYRRDITRDGLFGFVAFASINSVTEENNKFERINPLLVQGYASNSTKDQTQTSLLIMESVKDTQGSQ